MPLLQKFIKNFPVAKNIPLSFMPSIWVNFGCAITCHVVVGIFVWWDLNAQKVYYVPGEQIFHPFFGWCAKIFLPAQKISNISYPNGLLLVSKTKLAMTISSIWKKSSIFLRCNNINLKKYAYFQSNSVSVDKKIGLNPLIAYFLIRKNI